MIGYLVEQELGNLLPFDKPLATILTMIEVDINDPAFQNPSKPIGPIYDKATADAMAAEKQWTFKPDGSHHRRVVPSPKPIRIFELRQIRWLLERGAVVICAGGGGIPVMYADHQGPAVDGGPDRQLVGVEAVIDKDHASGLLATGIDADYFIMATDADAAYVGLGQAHPAGHRPRTPGCPGRPGLGVRGRLHAAQGPGRLRVRPQQRSPGRHRRAGRHLRDARRDEGHHRQHRPTWHRVPRRLRAAADQHRPRSPSMPVNLRNRSFLKEIDFTPEELRFLLKLSADLKEAKATGTEQPRLRGRNIALIFEKTSTRTRCAFEVAAFDQGAHVTYLDPSGSQMGHKESVADTARVLGRYYDGIEYRGKIPGGRGGTCASTPACPSSTASPMNGTPPRRWPTS